MGARDLDPILSIEYTTDPMWYKFPSLSPYNAMGNNPIMFIDPDGNFTKPVRSRIEYGGNGVFRVNLNNLNRATRNNYNAANENSNNWTYNKTLGQKDIGINRDIGEIRLRTSQVSNRENYMPFGVEQQHTSTKTVAENAKSTGLPDKRVSSPTMASGAASVGGAVFTLALDAFFVGYNLWEAFSVQQDLNAIDRQKGLLQQAFKEVMNTDLVPSQYQNNNDIGAIVNFVFQGVNDTGNKDITKIGTDILKSINRYDTQTKRVKPLIEE
jgi:hypothetical protein